MIIGIGNDLVLIDRIEKLLNNFENKFLAKVFTQNEINMASQSKQNISQFYAKRFAAKEAFSKAIGLGIGRGINFNDIEISNDALGKPIINLLNDKKVFLLKHFACEELKFHLSLSDEKNLAIATVIIEK